MRARLAVAFASGLIFAIGLGLSGMTDPRNVIGFLDVFGDWNPSLALVMAGALAVFAAAHRLVSRRGGPLFDAAVHLPSERRVTARLVVGSVLFGAGWGLSGYCPGPAIVSLGSVKAAGPELLTFVAAMVLGAGAGRLWLARRPAAARASQPSPSAPAPELRGTSRSGGPA